jgi:hypothetical protein
MPVSLAAAAAVPMGETPQVGGHRQVEAASMPLGEAPCTTSPP